MAVTTLETQYFEYNLTLSPNSSPPSISLPVKAAYATLGSPSSPAILMPTCFAGRIRGTSNFLWNPEKCPQGSQVAFSPEDYFIIIVGILGGSESSSPSNTSGLSFPKTTYADNVTLQKALCEHLGVKKLRAYIGFSMGGQQAYHMAALYPDFVEKIVCLAGSAKTSAHNWSFLEGPKAALVNSADFYDGKYTDPVKKGTAAFGRVYSTWALSQQWFREESWKLDGYTTLADYITNEWEIPHARWDANDLMHLMWTWQQGDITDYGGGDLAGALKRIKAQCLIMPSRTDMYFPPEDNEEEAKHLGDKGCLKVIESIHGHLGAEGAGTADDTNFMIQEISKFVRGD